MVAGGGTAAVVRVSGTRTTHTPAADAGSAGASSVDEHRDRAAGEGRSDGLRAALAVAGHRDEERTRRHPVDVEAGARGDRCLRVAPEYVVVVPGQ